MKRPIPVPVTKVSRKMWALRNRNTGDMVRDDVHTHSAVMLFESRQFAREVKYSHETPIRVVVTVEEIW